MDREWEMLHLAGANECLQETRISTAFSLLLQLSIHVPSFSKPDPSPKEGPAELRPKMLGLDRAFKCLVAVFIFLALLLLSRAARFPMLLLVHNESRPALLFVPLKAGQDGILKLVILLFIFAREISICMCIAFSYRK